MPRARVRPMGGVVKHPQHPSLKIGRAFLRNLAAVVVGVFEAAFAQARRIAVVVDVDRAPVTFGQGTVNFPAAQLAAAGDGFNFLDSALPPRDSITDVTPLGLG